MNHKFLSCALLALFLCSSCLEDVNPTKPEYLQNTFVSTVDDTFSLTGFPLQNPNGGTSIISENSYFISGIEAKSENGQFLRKGFYLIVDLLPDNGISVNRNTLIDIGESQVTNSIIRDNGHAVLTGVGDSGYFVRDMDFELVGATFTQYDLDFYPLKVIEIEENLVVVGLKYESNTTKAYYAVINSNSVTQYELTPADFLPENTDDTAISSRAITVKSDAKGNVSIGGNYRILTENGSTRKKAFVTQYAFNSAGEFSRIGSPACIPECTVFGIGDVDFTLLDIAVNETVIVVSGKIPEDNGSGNSDAQLLILNSAGNCPLSPIEYNGNKIDEIYNLEFINENQLIGSGVITTPAGGQNVLISKINLIEGSNNCITLSKEWCRAQPVLPGNGDFGRSMAVNPDGSAFISVESSEGDSKITFLKTDTYGRIYDDLSMQPTHEECPDN